MSAVTPGLDYKARFEVPVYHVDKSDCLQEVEIDDLSAAQDAIATVDVAMSLAPI